MCVQAVLEHSCFKCSGNIEQLSIIFVPTVSPPIVTPSLPTPIRVNRFWFTFLWVQPVHCRIFFYSDFRFGFPIHFKGIRVSSIAKNLISASHHPEVIDTKINKELWAHRLAGPFQFPSLHRFPHWELFLRRSKENFVSYTTCPIRGVPQLTTVLLLSMPWFAMQLLTMPPNLSWQAQAAS